MPPSSGATSAWIVTAFGTGSVSSASSTTFTNKGYDAVYTRDWTGASGRLHHIAFATDTSADIIRAPCKITPAGLAS